MSHPILVVGGGPAGLEAACLLGELGQSVVLVEKSDVLGGTPIQSGYAALTPDFRDATEAFTELAERVRGFDSVDVRMGTVLTEAAGGVGNFSLSLSGGDTLQAGAVILATGFQHFDPGRETQQYGYYEFDDVVTLVDLERLLKQGTLVRPSNGEPPERLCFIQCVGSRDRQIGNEYCSKVCCGVAAKQSIEVRKLLPDCKVFIFYIDRRMYGFWENEIYWPSQEQYKVNYIKGIPTQVIARGDKLLVRGEDTTMGRPMEVPMDMVVLSVGMEPSAGTREMAALFGLAQDKYRFIETSGGALDTVSTTVPGIFACGASVGPADFEDCVSTAGAAAIKAMAAIRNTVGAA